ncbi:FGGY-family carbohydrate kinase [Succinatimonas hippei]|uniref:FGGY-family carbohydrate kinase n=1 Tax=Succinatimonas hippei TaxID=626938 RepID=UPI0023F8EB2C|nr:glycerol kinase GlpK [Succinatimonas hippei]
MADDVLVLGIDQSTQGTKALLFDAKGEIIDKETIPHRQIINDKGYVEHNLNEIAANVIEGVRRLVSRDLTRASRIAAVGLSVQRETVGAWQKSTLKPLYNAIVWQCARGAEFVSRDEVKSKADRVREITGLELSEFFSAAKITWLVDNVPEILEFAAKNDLCIGNIDSFLISRLTNGEAFATEPSNASRTQLMDIHTLNWSNELCTLFKVPMNALPPILDSDALFGMTDFDGVLERKIPIHAAIGDSQGALFGQGCLKPGQTKTTYGTGSSIMMNAGDKVVSCKRGIVNSVGWRRSSKVTYVLEGNINYSAGVISWLKDDLKLISDPKETKDLAEHAHAADKTYFVPAFSGLGAPYFTGSVRGTIVGMSRVTGKNEIVRAALDSIAYQVNDVVGLIRKSAPIDVSELSVDGGATRNDYLMQFQADLLNLPLKVPKDAELSGMGAAYMAGIAAGIYSNDILIRDKTLKSFIPKMDDKTRNNKTDGWHKAVKTALAQGC